MELSGENEDEDAPEGTENGEEGTEGGGDDSEEVRMGHILDSLQRLNFVLSRTLNSYWNLRQGHWTSGASFLTFLCPCWKNTDNCAALREVVFDQDNHEHLVLFLKARQHQVRVLCLFFFFFCTDGCATSY